MKQFQRPRVDLYARRTFSENLSATFDFVSENFRTLFRFLTAFILPLCAVGALCYMSTLGQVMKMEAMGENELGMLTSLGTNYLLTILVSFLASAVLTGVVYTLMQQYWARPDRLKGLTYADIKPTVWHNIGKMVNLYFLIAAFGIGLFVVFFIIAGLASTVSASLMVVALLVVIAMAVAVVPLFLSGPAYILGGQTVTGAFKQAMRYGYRVLLGLIGLVIILYLICSLVSTALSMPFYILAIIQAIAGVDQGTSSLQFTSSFWFTLINYLSAILALYGMFVGYALLHVGLAFYYGHAAEKVDGVSMTKTVDEFENLGGEASTSPSAEDKDTDDESDKTDII